MKNEKQKEKVVDDEMRKSKSEVNIDKKKDTNPNEGKEVPYPLVSSQKGKERHLARFLCSFSFIFPYVLVYNSLMLLVCFSNVCMR